MADENEEQPEFPEMEDQYILFSKVESMACDWMDYNCDKVCRDGVEEKFSSFLRRNNNDKFKAKVEEFKKLIMGCGILCQNPTSNPHRKFYFSGNFDRYSSLFKFIKE